ncbi:MAG: DUF4197 domain-containing protein [Alphaproteobacteria bacterium]|nr:DUF4197 domain-containing protein [Alphaproteobacteria bacterium]
MIDRRSLIVVTMSLVAPPVFAHGTLDSIRQGVSGGMGAPGASGSTPGANRGAGLGNDEIGRGLKEALRVGSDRVVSTLGRPGGFWGSRDVQIPLPSWLASAQRGLKTIGKSQLVDELHLRMNRGAEAAVPKAKQLFYDAITAMTLDDARRILNGPSNAATEYFRGKMSSPLARDMSPIVDRSLADAGAVQSLDRVASSAPGGLGGTANPRQQLTRHVVEKGIDAVFTYLGREEASIRQNPTARTTDLLKRVFS